MLRHLVLASLCGSVVSGCSSHDKGNTSHRSTAPTSSDRQADTVERAAQPPDGGHSSGISSNLYGVWSLWSSSGIFDWDLPVLKDEHTRIAFQGTSFTWWNAEGERHTIRGTYECDLAKFPHVVTFRTSDRVVSAIFEVSGDTLRLCVGDDGLVPPSAFPDTAELRKTVQYRALMVLQRDDRK